MFEASRDVAEEVLRETRGNEVKPDDEFRENKNKIIANAAKDVRVLVSYLSRTYRPTIARDEALIPVACLKVLHSIERSKVILPSEEVFLWTFLGELSAAVHPATPDTIRNSTIAEEIGVDMIDHRDRRARYAFWGAAVLIFLGTLIVGAYLALADRAIAENQTKTKEFLAIVAGNYAGTRLDGVLPPTPGGEDASIVGATTTNTSEAAPDTGSIAKDYADPLRTKDRALSQIATEIIDNDRRLRILSFPGAFLLDKQEASDPPLRPDVFDRNAVINQQAINGLLSAFVLPVLSALLGAIVYIIRDTYARRENIQLLTRQYAYYWPRIILSAISGVIVGWLSDKNGDLLGQLSPVIVAFMIGYSTDVLFNVLDNVKVSLGGRNLSLK